MVEAIQHKLTTKEETEQWLKDNDIPFEVSSLYLLKKSWDLQ